MDSTKLNLLLVEDDEIDREALHRLLDKQFNVSEAETATEAKSQIATRRPDCVILDYHLPDTSGLNLIPYLVGNYIPVILSTGEESPRIIVEAMQKGAQDYLVKGRLTKERLEQAIHNAVEKVGLQRHVVQQQVQLAEQANRLEEKNRQVHALATALALAEQRERRRIAQVLHDYVQQILYGIQMRTFLITMDYEQNVPERMREHLAEMESLVEEAIQTARTLTVELSPPVLQSEGLGAALMWLAGQMQQVHNLGVDLEIAADYQLESDDLRVLVFQLVRELLFNVVKHAQVDKAIVRMRQEDDRLLVEVIDNGIGFEPAKLSEDGRDNSGFGLRSIRERLSLFDGKLHINSRVGEGTQITIELPMLHKLNESLSNSHEKLSARLKVDLNA